ncbi:putative GH43/DUF377 family glycosyl hydrolase [Marisediminicola sp. UYEF4]
MRRVLPPVTERLPDWERLKRAAPDHVSPAPTMEAQKSSKHGVEHTAHRLLCTCGHSTVWSARAEDAISKWMNHLAVESGLKPRTDHRKVTPGSHPGVT